MYSLYISIQYPLYRLIAVHPHLFCTLCTVSATFWNILECSRTCTPAFDFQPDFQPSAFIIPILVFSLQLCKTGHYLALAWPQFCQCNLYTFFKFALTDWWTDGRSDNIVLYRGSALPKKRNIIQMFNFLFPLLIITWYCGAEISRNQNFTIVVFYSPFTFHVYYGYNGSAGHSKELTSYTAYCMAVWPSQVILGKYSFQCLKLQMLTSELFQFMWQTSNHCFFFLYLIPCGFSAVPHTLPATT